MLILKIVILISIVVISTLIGLNKAKRYENREYILREAILLFKGIENEIKYTLATVPNAIESVRVNMKTKLKDVLGIVSFELLQYNVSKEKISDQISTLAELSNYDRQVLSNGIIELGNSDVEGQIGVIELTLKTLENQLNESIEIKNKNSKLYKTVGICAGLVIAIILI